jgi:hypothetical protein
MRNDTHSNMASARLLIISPKKAKPIVLDTIWSLDAKYIPKGEADAKDFSNEGKP